MRFAPALVVGGAIALLGRGANASPGDGYAMSDDAALMGGVAVASGRDATSAWYNPALLAGNRRNRADVSAGTYGLRWLKLDGGVTERVGPAERRRKIAGRELLVVPTAFAVATEVRDGLTIGFGFFTSISTDTSLNLRVVDRNQTAGYRYVEEIRTGSHQRRYHAGPMLGWRASEGFEIGVAAMAVYDEESSSSRLFVDGAADDTPARASVLRDRDASVQSYGTEAVLGIRGKLGRIVWGGVSVRTPAIVLFQRVEGSQSSIETQTDLGGVTTATADLDTGPIRQRPVRVAPWRVSTGIAIGEGRWAVGADIEAAPALQPDVPEVGQLAVWNARAGGRYRVDGRWTVGAGVFTDRNTEADRTFGAAAINLWGGSFGVQLKTPVKLARKEAVRRLAFRTTVALRYAGGRGQAGRLNVAYPDDGPAPVALSTGSQTDASMHLLTLHVGSAVVF